MSRVSQYFGDPRRAGPEGYLGTTARITPELLLEAYSHGIFPWSDRPARWYSPDPRSVFELSDLRLPRRLQRVVRSQRFKVTFDQAFREVMIGCFQHHFHSPWISLPMIEVYCAFHQQGYAHSVEVWRQGRLVGGLYGVQIGAFYAGESMFHREPNASKVAFAHLVDKLRELGVVLFDSQVLNEHTASLGAVEIPREQYLSRLEQALALGQARACWRPKGYQQIPCQDS
jgi:leucyl/phenylalanyl-tRNA--protein transferase